MPGMDRVSLRRSRLAAELRRLHEASGMTLDDVEEKTEIKRSTVSRIHKTGTTNVPYVRLLLGCYGANDRLTESLVALTKEAGKRGGWWSAHSNALTAELMEFVSFEQQASTLYAWELALVPGLLQTRAYAEEIIREATEEELPEDTVAARAETRMRRQDRLTGNDPLSLYAVLDESVLHRPTGGSEVMTTQLDHLLKMSRKPNIHLHVVSASVGAHAGMFGSYRILEFVDPYTAPVVYLETIGGEMYLEGEEHLAKVRRLWDHLRGAALDKEASRRRIRKAAETMRNDG